jgi:hypothetical protein
MSVETKPVSLVIALQKQLKTQDCITWRVNLQEGRTWVSSSLPFSVDIQTTVRDFRPFRLIQKTIHICKKRNFHRHRKAFANGPLIDNANGPLIGNKFHGDFLSQYILGDKQVSGGVLTSLARSLTFLSLRQNQGADRSTQEFSERIPNPGYSTPISSCAQ